MRAMRSNRCASSRLSASDDDDETDDENDENADAVDDDENDDEGTDAVTDAKGGAYDCAGWQRLDASE